MGPGTISSEQAETSRSLKRYNHLSLRHHLLNPVARPQLGCGVSSKLQPRGDVTNWQRDVVSCNLKFAKAPHKPCARLMKPHCLHNATSTLPQPVEVSTPSSTAERPSAFLPCNTSCIKPLINPPNSVKAHINLTSTLPDQDNLLALLVQLTCGPKYLPFEWSDPLIHGSSQAH